jgi:ABC-type transport system substrate-binding protein
MRRIKMKTKKGFTFLLVLSMMALVLAGCGPTATEPAAEEPAVEEPAAEEPAAEEPAAEEPAAEEPAAEEPAADVASEVVVAIGADPANLGPFVGMSMGRISVLNTMYAYLFYVDPETGSLDPYLAESLENTAEKTYVVTLFDYITDSDGNHITAADVAFSYNTAMEANVYRPLGDVESVTATGDYTVEFVTKEVPGPGGIEKIVTECPIVSQVAYEASDDDFATMPTTPAAYVLTEYVPGSSLTFERRADYWQTDPSLSPVVATANVQKAVFQIITEPAQHTVALQTSSADVSTAIPGSDIALFDGDPDYTVFKRLDNLTTVLVFNGSEGNPFTSKELRQAVAYAIDTTAMCAAVSPGACNPASAIGNANFEGYLEKWEDESYYDYDLAKAKDLLEAAGFQPGDLTVKLLGQNDPRTGLVAQVVQAALAELGINVEISQVEPPVFQSDKADPTIWDIVIDATAGGDFIFSPWQLIFDQKRYNGTTSGWVKDDQLQALMDTAAAEDTFTPENVDAAWQYIKDTVYAYGLFSNVNNTVSVSGITEVFHDHRGFVLPGVCEYAPDF